MKCDGEREKKIEGREKNRRERKMRKERSVSGQFFYFRVTVNEKEDRKD